MKNHQTIHSTDKLTTDVYGKNVTQMQTLRGERTKGKMLRTNVQLSKIRNENKKKLNPEKTKTKKKQLQIWKTNYKAMGNKSRTQGRHEDQETDAPEQKN